MRLALALRRGARRSEDAGCGLLFGAAGSAPDLQYMNGGVIVEQGDPRDVIDNPTHERTIQFLRRLQEK